MASARGIAIDITRLCMGNALLFAFLGGYPLKAQFITSEVSQYAHTAWLNREGASPGSNLAITQTNDGNLWIGTPYGLLKFDGDKFIAGAPAGGEEFRDGLVEKVLGAKDGSLWIGGAGLSRLKGGQLTSIPELAGARIDAIMEDHAGEIWVSGRPQGTTNRLCHIIGSTTKCFDDSKSFGLQIRNLFEDKAGNLWISAENGMWRWAPGKPEFYPNRFGESDLAIDARDVMVGMPKGNSRVQPRDQVGPVTRIPLLMSDLWKCVFLTDHLGGLWIGTRGKGLIHSFHGRIDTYKPVDGLSSDVVFDLFEDHEQNIWAVTANGIDRFRRQAVTLVTTKQGLSSNAICSLLSDGRTVWIATHSGLNRVRGGEIKQFESLSGADVNDVSTLFARAEGHILISAGPPDGIAWLEHDRVQIQHAPIGRDTYAVASDGADGVWLSNRQSGLVHILRVGGRIEVRPWSRFDNKIATAIAFDPVRKGLWLAFHRGDLVFFQDDQVKERYHDANQFFQYPRDLRVDTNGTVWFGSSDGLSRLKHNELATLSRRNGLPCDGVHWKQEDDRHAIWMETPCGVVQLSPGELDRWSEDPHGHVDVETYLDNLDGAQNTFMGRNYNPAVSMTPDGSLAYGTDSGLAIIDPHQELKNPIEPPVHIDTVEADAQDYAIEKPISLAPKTQIVRLAYSALSFRAPQKVRFRYKLQGYDTKWSEVLSAREAVYRNLPPGSYKFHVIACNDSGVWNTVGDTLTFNVRAAFYQTRWFLWICVAACSALLWITYRARVNYLCREVSNRIQAQTSERLNVARDLHDTLLQGVQGLILSFHALSEDTNVDLAVRERILTLSGRAEEVVSEGRDKIRTLRSENRPGRGLVEELCILARRIHPDDLPAFQVSMEGQEIELTPFVFEELCLICREALTNAFRHSNARKVVILVVYGRSRFRVEIRDDGRGLPFDIRRPGALEGHWGIVGMTERAAGIGARFDISTPHPGESRPGTRISIELPATLAYARSKHLK
jgi:signal transduction histidine kinase/ligand-binding sensor domain-containing protein